MTDRRRFLAVIAAAIGAPLTLRAQGGDSVMQTMFGPMDEAAYRPVRLPNKAGVRSALDDEQRDSLERDLKCQCGCTLDVYTCRTTDFTCPVSPAMHRDVMALVAGGYDAREIRAAFVSAYGEQVLMAPVRSGFNLVGYALPLTLIVGALGLVTLLGRKWTRRRAAVAGSPSEIASDATTAELAEIEAALRRDE